MKKIIIEREVRDSKQKMLNLWLRERGGEREDVEREGRSR